MLPEQFSYVLVTPLQSLGQRRHAVVSFGVDIGMVGQRPVK
jgi:hypothetical protein